MKKIKISKTNEYLYYKKINNGLEIFVLPNNNQKNFYITFNTKFGSNNIEFKKNNESNPLYFTNHFKHRPIFISDYIMYHVGKGIGLFRTTGHLHRRHFTL